jgi:hypothetical protein
MTVLNASGQVRVSWVPTLDGAWTDITDSVSGLEFVTGPPTPIELLSKAQRFLVVPTSLLEQTGPYTLRLRGRLLWSGYRLVFGRTCPRSRRIKAEYRRRVRARSSRSR